MGDEHIWILPPYLGENPLVSVRYPKWTPQAVPAHVGSRPQLGPVSDLPIAMFLTDMLLPAAQTIQSNGGPK